MQDTLAVILAGGVGSRLSPLTDERTKPAVPFGGKYRIIDFTLTNCLHSGLRKILVLTQNKSHSLQKHLRDGWSIFNPELGEFITAIPPQRPKDGKWYDGSAEAIYQNDWLLTRSEAKYVVVLSGDHIYRMDYAAMVEEHKENGAAMTIATMKVAVDKANEFGILGVNQDGQVTSFTEKPRRPATLPEDPEACLASMGIYVFDMEILLELLEADSKKPDSQHDFGQDIIPHLVSENQVFAYQFSGKKGRVDKDSYWRDINDIDDYYQANMDLLEPTPPMNLYQRNWPIRTYERQLPPARTVSSGSGNEGIFINSIISNGVVNAGGSVHHSIMSANVRILDSATVSDSILLDDVEVGENCQISRCIIDKHVKIPANTTIGFDPIEDGKRFQISEQGIVIIPEHYQF